MPLDIPSNMMSVYTEMNRKTDTTDIQYLTLDWVGK